MDNSVRPACTCSWGRMALFDTAECGGNRSRAGASIGQESGIPSVHASSGPVRKYETLLVKTVSGTRRTRRPDGSLIRAILSMTQAFQRERSDPRYLSRSRSKRAGSIDSIDAAPRIPRCSRCSFLSIEVHDFDRATRISAKTTNRTAVFVPQHPVGPLLPDKPDRRITRTVSVHRHEVRHKWLV
ncbi:hypothetical protein SAMN04490248_1447 [Salinihabitans flavidus]|uniref:Uncharacterized protein n=1 Tax=Salinihabitans flavidus TaxID=569882 RepID=A0A1H8W589_9RHOB|nr:hypothetical protein SAMN04490248_1447 [Salinihabitans flavidus]